MTKPASIILSFWLFIPILSFSQQGYTYLTDLVNIKNDQVSVTLETPSLNADTVIYSFPKAIPGSYAVKDFGRFIKEFKAYNKNGKQLPVQKINNNQYQITRSKTLAGIHYLVNDTWDTNHPNFVFQPGGSNIEEGKNFVINNHAFYGYFEGYKNLPITLKITRPLNFYASTHLPVQQSAEGVDVLQAANYNFLADNPIIYSQPDTTSFIAGDSRIHVTVVSATGKVTSAQVASYLKPLSMALQTFFNGLPVKSYQFLFYFDKPENALGESGGGGYGALEHSYSSLYYLPEIAMESRVKSLVLEVAGHEFLHILTPLNLHSEQIENFDFINPEMSEHLWLYEGVTEYFANLVQLQSGLLSEKEFFGNMKEKMEQAKEFGQFSMTEMSKNVLTEAYKSKYNSVYSKGALLAFMLDLYIREKTHNNIDLKSAIQKLALQYGPNKPFKDEDLFKELVSVTHPDVNTFIANYIVGSQPLPFKEMLATIGYEYAAVETKVTYNIGQKLSLKFDVPSKQFVFSEVGNNALLIKNNDVLVSIDNTAVTEENLNDLWDKYVQYNFNLPDLSITVLREGEKLVLQGKLFKGRTDVKNYLAPMNAVTFHNNLTWPN
ncbi:MAG: hypothetical protein LH478_10245 [Chitinophagaceae bacterium]|nr:hypothetical protein [Chitinophagaceae bacterium]